MRFPSTATTSGTRLALTLVILLHLAYLAYFAFRPQAPLPDSLEYLHAAENLFTKGQLYAGDLSEDPREALYTRRTPGYPLLLGPAVLSNSGFPVFLLQTLISLTGILLVWRIFLRGKKGPLWPGLVLLLFMPAQFIYSNLMMAEILFQFILVLLSMLVFSISSQGPGSAQAKGLIWAVSIVFTIGMATKPVLYPLLFLLIPLSVYFFFRFRQKVFLFALVLPLLWLGGYSLRNQARTGSMEYSSIQSTNLVNYNLRYYLIGKEGRDAADQRIDSWYEDAADYEDYASQSRYVKARARELVLSQPLSYGFYHFRGMAGFFLDPGRFDLVHAFGLSEGEGPGLLQHFNEQGLKGVFRYLAQQGWGLVIVLGLIFGVKLLKLAGFGIYLFRGSHPLAFRLYLGGLVAYLAAVTGPLGASRFFLPVELLYTAAALLGLYSLTYRVSGTPR